MKKYFEKFGHKCKLEDDDEEDFARGRIKRTFTMWKTVDPTSILTSQYFNSHAAIINERRSHLQYFPTTFHPFSRIVMIWEFLMLFVFSFGLIYGPFQFVLSTDERMVDPIESVAIMLFAKILCLVDMARRFFTGFYDERSDKIILSRRIITKRYLRGLFFIDLITNIPLSVGFILSSSLTDSHLNYIRLFNMFRICRLPTVVRYFNNFLVRMRIDERFIDVYKLTIYWITTIHFVACLHVLPGLIKAGFRHTPVNAWYQSDNYKDATMLTKYIMCLSKAVKAFMGAGHIKSLQDKEAFDQIFSSCVTVFGRAAIFVTLAYVFEIIKGIMSSTLRYDELMVELDKYTEHNNLPSFTRSKLKQNYDHIFCKRYFNEKEILNTVSNSLRHDILVFNTRELVENSPFFKDLPSSLVIKIILSLSAELYLEGDVIFMQGSLGMSIFFIISGSVAYFSPSGKEICHFSDGDYFGEITMVSEMKHQYAKAVALETTECYILGKDDCKKLIHAYPDLLQKVKSVATERVERVLLTEQSETRRKPFEYSSVNQTQYRSQRRSSTFSVLSGN